MNKMKNKFIALLVAFTSIVSFSTVGFSGQAADAATIGTDATTIQVNVTGSTTALTATTDTVTQEEIYAVEGVEAGFDISVQDVSTDATTLETQAFASKQSTSGIVGQKVEIVSINGTPVTDTTTLNDIGIGITNYSPVLGIATRVGTTITGLPLGVNKIQYKITITTQDIDYTPAVTDSIGNIIQGATAVPQATADTAYANQELTIEHATAYVVNKINPMTFKAYVGQASSFNDSDEITDSTLNTNNTVPFLYSTEAQPDANMALRYTFDVPDSISTLRYVMTFDKTITLDGANVYKNGTKAVEGTEYTIDGQQLTGDLERLGQSDSIVVKLNGTGDTSSISKAYAIEIRYNNLSSNQDYSLKNAGITKLNYNDDSSVPAYIGKEFTITDNSSGFKVYNGNIYIDSKATMISIDPTLIRSKDTVAYVVTNNYVDSSGTTRVKQSILKNGSEFVDYMASTTSNVLQVDVYAGQNGNVTDSSVPLARYLLNVNLITGNEFTMNLGFESSDTTYLTQPGVKANIIDAFTTSRLTYDLYCGDPLKVSFTGKRSSKNEYLRVWLADDINSNNLTEATASVDNALDSNNTRATSLDVDLNGAKKMVVQAYYDEFTETTTGSAAYVSYAVGDQYVFNLPNNYDSSDTSSSSSSTSSTSSTSSNALLNNLKITDATLEDSDGNSTFSSSVYSYTTAVGQSDTTAKITATAQDDNVESIVATVQDTGTSYDLTSGEASDITLDTNGTTTVNIVVTAQDGTTTKTYTVIIKNNTKGSDVTLSNVILNTGDYTFDSTADTTKVHVSQNTTSINVTPVPENSSATVTVDGQEYSSNAITVDLKGAQETDVDIVVTPEDGTESKTYTLQVYRTDSANWNGSSDSSQDPTEDDQYYDTYNQCWVDTNKYEEWGTVSSKPVYFDKNNRQVKDAWVYRSSGWKVDDADGKTYYLDPTTGEMRTGWMNLNNSWYYLGLNGVMHKGWLSLNGKWYYFTPNGQMVINQSMFIDDKVYNFGQDGAIY